MTNSGGVLILVNGGVSNWVEGDRGLGTVGESESCPHHQLKGCQWVSRRVNRCIASGKGVETGGNLYLDMEVAKGSEVAGTTVTDTPL